MEDHLAQGGQGQNQAQYSRFNLMITKYRSAITAFKPLVMLLFIQPRMLTAFFLFRQAVDSCSAVDSYSCPDNPPPTRAFSAKPLPSQLLASANEIDMRLSPQHTTTTVF